MILANPFSSRIRGCVQLKAGERRCSACVRKRQSHHRTDGPFQSFAFARYVTGICRKRWKIRSRSECFAAPRRSPYRGLLPCHVEARRQLEQIQTMGCHQWTHWLVSVYFLPLSVSGENANANRRLVSSVLWPLFPLNIIPVVVIGLHTMR